MTDLPWTLKHLLKCSRRSNISFNINVRYELLLHVNTLQYVYWTNAHIQFLKHVLPRAAALNHVGFMSLRWTDCWTGKEKRSATMLGNMDMIKKGQKGCEPRHAVEAGSRNCFQSLKPQKRKGLRASVSIEGKLQPKCKGSSRSHDRILVLHTKGFPKCLEVGTGRRHQIHREICPPGWKLVCTANGLSPVTTQKQTG